MLLVAFLSRLFCFLCEINYMAFLIGDEACSLLVVVECYCPLVVGGDYCSTEIGWKVVFSVLVACNKGPAPGW